MATQRLLDYVGIVREIEPADHGSTEKTSPWFSYQGFGYRSFMVQLQTGTTDSGVYAGIRLDGSPDIDLFTQNQTNDNSVILLQFQIDDLDGAAYDRMRIFAGGLTGSNNNFSAALWAGTGRYNPYSTADFPAFTVLTYNRNSGQLE